MLKLAARPADNEGVPLTHSDPSQPKRSWPRRVGAAAFWIWALASIALAASLMVTHTYALPSPELADPALQAAVATSRGGHERGRWLMVHVLYSRCRCSARILDHLFARKALPDAAERVVLVGANAEYERRAREAGFEVEVLSPAELPTRYTLSAVPALVIADPQDAIRYVGGYTARKQGPAPEDTSIYERVRSGARATALPLFGCAVSQSLRGRLDPLLLRSLALGEE